MSSDDSKTHDIPEAFQIPPKTQGDLHDWIETHIGIAIAHEPTIEGHAAPFEYLCHTFFEGRGEWPSDDARAPAPDAAPLDCIVWANRGGGKTFLGALATALDLIYKRGIQIRILAGSLEQAQHMHQHLRAIFERETLADLIDGRITDRRIRLKTGSQVQLLAQSQASVRGTRVQKLRCDEVELFSPEVWQAAQLTTRSAVCGDIYVRGSIECLSTMHKPYGMMAKLVREAGGGGAVRRRIFKWGVADCLEKCPDAFKCKATPEHPDIPPCPLLAECAQKAKEKNRIGHIPVEDALRMKSRVSAAVWESEMLCIRPDRGDSVFPEFSRARHVAARTPEAHELTSWIGGMDFGFRAPTVILWGALDAVGRLWIIDERIATQTLLADHIRVIHSAPWPRLAWIGVDPAGDARTVQTGQSDIAILRASGLRPRRRASLIKEGLRLIRARLGPADNSGPRLLIHQRCTGLIEAMERYHYDPRDPENEEPVKDGPDHACDALRYMVVNLDNARAARVDIY